MKEPLRLLFAAAEVAPLAKVGGLADVAGSLPKSLACLGQEVRLVMPRHRGIDEGKFPSSVRLEFNLWFMGHDERVVLREARLDTVPLYLVESGKFFDRPSIYGQPDDLERYLFFSAALLELPQRLGWMPHVLHCHDWHTAPAVLGLRNRAQWDPPYRGMASVLTIHNLRYRGPDPFTDFLCQGIYYADMVNTVSENYAREILTPEYGEGLELLLQLKGERLRGILNGIDQEAYSPATDPFLASHYDARHLERRAPNKAALQQKANLEVNPDVPLLGMVSRLAEQKGFDLLLGIIDRLLAERRVQLVILGLGEEPYPRLLEEAVKRHPGQFRLFLGFDPALAQLIYAGADLFLMPSRFEPCGLGQMIALRYGAIPVVRATGGLADTVQELSPDLTQGNGFVFHDYRPQDFLEAIVRALSAIENKAAWRALQKRAMGLDFSWDASARKYVQLYRQALELKRGGR